AAVDRLLPPAAPAGPPAPTTTPGAEPTGGTVTARAPSSVAPATDGTAPLLSFAVPRRGGLAAATGRGLRVRLRCSEACRTTLVLDLDAPLARRLHRARTVVRVHVDLAAGERGIRVLRAPRSLARRRV